MERSEPKPATRADVAARAGVSTALVSYVVTGARPVGPAAEARVRRAIDELGYRPNRTARALRTGRTDALGLVITDITNPYFAEFALAIEQAAQAEGRAVIVGSTQADSATERRLIEDFLDRGVDGLILGSHHRDGLPVAGSRIPVVRVDTVQQDGGITAVGPAMADGAERVVRHLIEVHGLRSVALALGDGERTETDQRQVGWSAALRAAGLPEGPVVQAPWSREGGYECGRRLFERTPVPEAVFAASDLIAIGLLRAAADAGLRIPEDVAVVSYDGTAESEFSTPRLTTLRQPIAEMARAAVAAVLDPEAASPYQQFEGELIVRESCGCARGR